MDQFLTGKYTAIPTFIGIMAAVFYLTFNVIGAWLSNVLDMGIGWLTDMADALLTKGEESARCSVKNTSYFGESLEEVKRWFCQRHLIIFKLKVNAKK